VGLFAIGTGVAVKGLIKECDSQTSIVLKTISNPVCGYAKKIQVSVLTAPIQCCRMKKSIRGTISRVTEPQIESLV
jgi:hypothetical protein